MIGRIDHTPPYIIYPTTAQAQAVADEWNAQEDEDWTAEIRVDPVTGERAFVVLFDEDGIELGPLPNFSR